MGKPMSELLPIVYLARQGEAAWPISGQHTGRTDLPLTERGERNARRLQERWRGVTYVKVFTSPLQRIPRTCELAGFGSVAEIDRDLLEWNYGEHEGRLTIDIHKGRPDWHLFRDGCLGGESPNDVAVRPDRIVKRVRAVKGDVLVFSSGHFQRVFAARWRGRRNVPPRRPSIYQRVNNMKIIAAPHDRVLRGAGHRNHYSPNLPTETRRKAQPKGSKINFFE